MESLSPNIFVYDINETIEFYKKIGFNIAMNVPEEGPFVWVMMVSGEVSFMFQTFESLGTELPQISRRNGGSLLLYIQVNDIVEFYNKVNDKVKVIKGIEKTFYGATEFSIIDNNGYVLTFAQNAR